MENHLVRDILIVGGGTSGWLCAAYMANTLGTAQTGGPRIRLMESSDIPTIGVGESTIPPIKSAIAATGISEAEFLKATKGTFKMAIRFDGFRKPVEGGREHVFYHAFGSHGRMGGEPLAPYWLINEADRRMSFVDYTMSNGPLITAGKGPKRLSDPPFKGPVDYAYQFDAGLLAKLLKDRACGLGVDHLIGTVAETKVDGENIVQLRTHDGLELAADLYIDCTGFGAHLIEKALGEPFVSASDILFCDRAVACQVPYADLGGEIPPYTRCVGRSSGWIWEVPLQHRRGTGYVYSSRHVSDEEARAVLLDFLGDSARGAEPRTLGFRVGHRARHWRGNCVAIGLSGGFIEPLESTGIYFSDIAIRWLSDFCLDKRQFAEAAAAFNERMSACYEDVIDFIKLHYLLSDRDDSPFWMENRDPASVPESLRHKLAMWSRRMPSEYEFGSLPAVFGYSNYVQIMMAMGFHPPIEALRARYRNVDEAERAAGELHKLAQTGLRVLPSHRGLLRDLAATA